MRALCYITACCCFMAWLTLAIFDLLLGAILILPFAALVYGYWGWGNWWGEGQGD